MGHAGSRFARAPRVALYVAFAIAAASPSEAGEPIELGGRVGFSVLASVTAESQFASALLVVGTDVTYITPRARFELGGGLRVIGLLAGPALLAGYAPYATARINTNLFGAEKNMLFYGGINVGAVIFTVDAGDEDESAVGFAGGPRFGFEYYLSPRLALRADNTVTVSDGIDTIAVSNTFSIGARILF